MTEREALKLALEALECTEYPQDHYDVITVIKEALAQPEQRIVTEQEHDVLMNSIKASSTVVSKGFLAQPEQEPEAFEEWLANQHGDPEEIGFLQALRIAYISGQDSITASPQRKPLTDEMTKQMRERCDSYEMRGAFVDGWLSAEAAHGIKE